MKNINGLRFLAKAVEYEAARHRAVFTAGGSIAMETRTYDVPSGTTVRMRGKEGGADYRFMPEPDLPPLHIPAEEVERLRRQLPLLPRATVLAMARTHGLSIADCRMLQAEPGAVAYFEACVRAQPSVSPAAILAWMVSELFALLRAEGMALSAASAGTLPPVSPGQLAELVALLEANTVTRKVAKEVFAAMARDTEGDLGPAAVLASRGGSTVIQVRPPTPSPPSNTYAHHIRLRPPLSSQH